MNDSSNQYFYLWIVNLLLVKLDQTSYAGDFFMGELIFCVYFSTSFIIGEIKLKNIYNC